MQIIRDRIICQFRQLLAHYQVSIYLHLEPSFHLLIVNLVFLAHQFLLVQINYICSLCTDIILKSLINSFFDQFHFFHHKCLRSLSSLHICNSHLFYAIEDFLFCRLIYIVHDLKFGTLSYGTLPLVYISWIKRLLVIHEICKIVSSYRHIIFLFLILFLLKEFYFKNYQ